MSMESACKLSIKELITTATVFYLSKTPRDINLERTELKTGLSINISMEQAKASYLHSEIQKKTESFINGLGITITFNLVMKNLLLSEAQTARLLYISGIIYTMAGVASARHLIMRY